MEISEGVLVDLLVTPHMAVYEEDAGTKGIGQEASVQEVLCRYADLMFLAALNAWELDGHGTREDFPHKRGDFHAFMQADTKGFGAAMTFMMTALTGKTVKELKAEEKAAEKAKDEAEAGGKGEGPEVKKKSWIYRITHRSRHSL